MFIAYNGKRVKAIRIGVMSKQEMPNSYMLENGGTIQLHTFLVDVFRLEGEVDQHGNPVYHLNWQVNPTVDSREEVATITEGC